MDVPLAEEQVKAWAEANSSALGFKGSMIEAAYIWNPGGFTNQSYRISDGDIVRHIKLVQERQAPRLKQWATISVHLTNNYYAPRMIGEITQVIIPEHSYGLVFDFIKGKPLSSIANPMAVIDKVLPTLKQLHHDREINKLIGSKDKARSYAEAFIEAYITRFEEDMQIIRSGKRLLNFVPENAIEWFDSEIAVLRQLVNQSPSFQQEATDVVHNDMNWANVLANDSFDFWIIDWDDLDVYGDAAMDYSVLLWPLYNSRDWTYCKDKIIALAGNEIFERMEVYFRAKHLDDVIDVLADYLEAENVPEVKEMTQKRAKDIHLRAYPEYLRLYAR